MLTSSLVIPNALNLKLPGKSNSNAVSNQQIDIIGIENNGNYTYNGSKVSFAGIQKKVRELKKRDSKAPLVITPAAKADNYKVVAILDMARRLGVTATLTDPR